MYRRLIQSRLYTDVTHEQIIRVTSSMGEIMRGLLRLIVFQWNSSTHPCSGFSFHVTSLGKFHNYQLFDSSMSIQKNSLVLLRLWFKKVYLNIKNPVWK